MTEGEQ